MASILVKSDVYYPAIIHTLMDKTNEAREKNEAKLKMLESLMPSLSSFLGENEEIPAAAAVSLPKTEMEREFELITKESKEGPIPYIDMKFNLSFNHKVEVWIDCLPASENVQNEDLIHKFLFLFEPNEITSLRSKVIQIEDQFVKVFSHDPETLSALNNAELFQHGGTWILPSAITQYGANEDTAFNATETIDSKLTSWTCRTKVFSVSFVCGSKKRTMGHHLRRNIWDKQESITIPKKFFGSGVGSSICDVKLPSAPCAKLLLFDNMFHVAIENVNQNDYFTEKLLDCFLTFTVPIYWGCPNIGSYFDSDGIIHVNELFEEHVDEGPSGCVGKKEANQVVVLLNNLTAEDYSRRHAAMRRNYDIALTFIKQRERMERAINMCL